MATKIKIQHDALDIEILTDDIAQIERTLPALKGKMLSEYTAKLAAKKAELVQGFRWEIKMNESNGYYSVYVENRCLYGKIVSYGIDKLEIAIDTPWGVRVWVSISETGNCTDDEVDAFYLGYNARHDSTYSRSKLLFDALAKCDLGKPNVLGAFRMGYFTE